MSTISTHRRSTVVRGSVVAPSQRGALAMLILVEVFAFSYMSETVVYPAMVGLAAVLGWQRPLRYRMSHDRQVIVALLLGILFVAQWRVIPHTSAEDTMPYLSPFLHALGQYLLLLQVAALYLWHFDDILPVTLPWPGVFVMVSAGDINATDGQRLTFQFIAIAFVAAAAFYFSASALAMRRNAHNSGNSDDSHDRYPQPTRGGFGKQTATAIVLLLTAAAAWTGSTALHHYERELNRIVSEILNNRSLSAGHAGFPSDSRLGSISEKKSVQAKEIALRIVSSRRPGYWRGKVYHWLAGMPLHGGRPITNWQALPPPELGRLPQPPRNREIAPEGHEGELNRFVLTRTGRLPKQDALGESGANGSADYSVWLAGPQRGTYFLPANAIWLDSSDDHIVADYRHIVSPAESAIAHYLVGIGSVTAANVRVRPKPGIFSLAELTHVPRHRDLAGGYRPIQALAGTIFANCDTVQDRVAAVETYFHTHYGYHVGIDVPRHVDPIKWFLRTKPNAHCEFFAQGAALLLRLGGVPTRYVTGFVVSERNDYGNYWVARNEDAHAWCEAWDPERGWIIVEATPAAGVPDANTAPWHRQAWEYFSGALQQFRFHLRQGGWPWLAGQVWRFLKTPAGWLVFLAILGYLGLRTAMVIAARKAETRPRLVIDLHRLLHRMDRRMERVGLTRPASQTLTDFAIRIAAETGDQQAAGWYIAYANARYDGQLDDDRVTRLKKSASRRQG